ncbi:hypothetical protein V1514DRAFT_334365 [Lipomyces japonicus]|uniref:uncharacterized protein n=1 Tax=Lipomyces japonicus TaxID=56871 RepID=UPI0034D0176C
MLDMPERTTLDMATTTFTITIVTATSFSAPRKHGSASPGAFGPGLIVLFAFLLMCIIVGGFFLFQRRGVTTTDDDWHEQTLSVRSCWTNLMQKWGACQNSFNSVSEYETADERSVTRVDAFENNLEMFEVQSNYQVDSEKDGFRSASDIDQLQERHITEVPKLSLALASSVRSTGKRASLPFEPAPFPPPHLESFLVSNYRDTSRAYSPTSVCSSESYPLTFDSSDYDDSSMRSRTCEGFYNRQGLPDQYFCKDGQLYAYSVVNSNYGEYLHYGRPQVQYHG